MNDLSDLSKAKSSALRSLVEFANADLDEFRRGDWTNLRDDLSDLFQLPMHVGTWELDPSDVEELQEKDLKHLQMRLHAILIPTRFPGMKGINKVKLDIGRARVGDRYLTTFGGTLPHLFVIRAIMLIDGEGAKISKCPECGNLFLVEFGKKYCSRRCSNLASVKRYQARKKEEQQ